MKHETRHIPVLFGPVIAALAPKPGDVMVDCTLGLGGHSAELLKRIRGGPAPGGKLIAIDFDPHNIELARRTLESIDQGRNEFVLVHNNFAALPTILAHAEVEKIDGLLADLGVASPQIDDPARGFSYQRAGPLDMRMDPTRGQPASSLVNRLSEQDLADAFLELGDETDAPKIARLMVQRRKQQPIMTTDALMAIICEARDFTIVRALGAKLHPAARTFQALRILVNRELANLDRLLAVLPDVLKPGATAAIISFHSGEDRRVKGAFKEGLRAGIYSATSPDPIIADDSEQQRNSRSRSAKLRWATRRR